MEFLSNIQVSVFITPQRFYQGPDMSRVEGKGIVNRVVIPPALLHQRSHNQIKGHHSC